MVDPDRMARTGPSEPKLGEMTSDRVGEPETTHFGEAEDGERRERFRDGGDPEHRPGRRGELGRTVPIAIPPEEWFSPGPEQPDHDPGRSRAGHSPFHD
jgi:hypothetical protein